MTPQQILINAYNGLANDFTKLHQELLQYAETTVESSKSVVDLEPLLKQLPEADIDPLLKEDLLKKIREVIKHQSASFNRFTLLLGSVNKMAQDAEVRAKKFYPPDHPV